MGERQDHLFDRWSAYHEAFLCGEASRETALSAYDDWLSSVDGPRHAAFEAEEGGKLLRGIGIRPLSVRGDR